uniref:Zgc:174356 n=1 Tax=Eptatretus burgeri TaxID=7764 RepID=A0A8C4NH64_EPTBU
MAACTRYLVVEPVMFLYMTGILISTPASQQLVLVKVCRELYGGGDICTNQTKEITSQVQSRASFISFLCASSMSLPSVLVSLFLGSWSDRTGRGLAMALPCMGAALGALTLLIQSMFMHLPAMLTVLSSACQGLLGGYVTIILSISSYIADETPGEDRTKRLGIMEAMIFMGSMLAGAVEGTVVDHASFEAVFSIQFSCNFLAMVWVFLFVKNPSSPTPQETQQILGQPAIPSRPLNLQNLKATWTALTRRREHRGRTRIAIIAGILMLINICNVGEMVIMLLFVQYPPLHFSNQFYGIFLSFKMGFAGLCLLLILPQLLKRIQDMLLGKAAVLFRIASQILTAFSNNAWMLFAAAALGGPSGSITAVLRSHASQIADSTEQGNTPGATLLCPSSNI